MRWKVEEKLKFIKQYKEAMVVPSIEGYTRKSMRRTIKKWVALYDLYGIDGIAHNKCQVFSYKEKLKAIRLINKGITYSEVALRFKVRDMSTVSKWDRLYLQYGPKGLLPKPKGRKSMALSQYIDSNLSLHDQCVLYRQLRIKEQYVNYINWYNKERIKLALKMSPIKYRLKYNKTHAC